MNIPVLYEDDQLAVINKPPGMVVNQAETVSEKTIQDWWQARMGSSPSSSDSDWANMIPADFDPQYGSPMSIFQERGGVVHRLDKDTSGVMVLAKNPGSLIHLLRQFKDRQTEKKYLALVHGKFQVPAAVISEPMGRASRDRKVFAVRPDGREAVTKYEVAQVFQTVDVEKVALESEIKLPELKRRFSIYEGFSLVNCWPKTGRTHQIRVHLAHIKHPIVGDVTYLGRKRQVLDPMWCPRQFLHASELFFYHPQSGVELRITAPLAGDLAQALTFLQ